MNWLMFWQMVLAAWIIFAGLRSASTGETEKRKPLESSDVISAFIAMFLMLMLIWASGGMSELL